jgi:tetratricopeptide (TPR) repeat protein
MSTNKTLAEEFGIKTGDQLDVEGAVLLIEDQQDLRLIVAHHLTKLGFRKIRQCANGHEAIHLVKDNPSAQFAIIIADKDMPLMGGYDFLNEIREGVQYTRGAFAITLDSPDKAEIMLASENGVDGILVKPFTLKDIIPKLRQAYKVFHNPNNPELVYELAKKELRSKNLDRAAAIYQRLAQGTQKAARPLVGLARVAMGKGNKEEALKLLSEAELRNKFYVHTFVERGRMLAADQQIEEAVKEFKRAIELSPLNPIRYEEAAELFFRMQRYDDAVDLLTLALNQNLSFPRLHHYLSQAHFAQKDYKKAIRHIKSALFIEPENVTYLNQLGVCYKESDQFDEAQKTYNTVIKLDPNNRSALYNKAIMLAAKGENQEAIKLLKRCLEKHPDFELAKKKMTELEAKSQKAAG